LDPKEYEAVKAANLLTAVIHNAFWGIVHAREEGADIPGPESALEPVGFRALSGMQAQMLEAKTQRRTVFVEPPPALELWIPAEMSFQIPLGFGEAWKRIVLTQMELTRKELREQYAEHLSAEDTPESAEPPAAVEGEVVEAEGAVGADA